MIPNPPFKFLGPQLVTGHSKVKCNYFNLYDIIGK